VEHRPKKTSFLSDLRDWDTRKRILVLLVPVIIAGCLAYYYNRSGRSEEGGTRNLEQQRTEAARKTIQAAVAKAVSDFGAMENWEAAAAGAVAGSDKGMAVAQYEKVWLSDKPILFKGHLADVTASGSSDYTIRVETITDPRFKPRQSLPILVVKVPKSILGPFLEKNPGVVSPFAQVAIIAKITKVEGLPAKKEQDVGEITGHGLCLAILDAGPWSVDGR
jgi:hypothetical protein